MGWGVSEGRGDTRETVTYREAINPSKDEDKGRYIHFLDHKRPTRTPRIKREILAKDSTRNLFQSQINTVVVGVLSQHLLLARAISWIGPWTETNSMNKLQRFRRTVTYYVAINTYKTGIGDDTSTFWIINEPSPLQGLKDRFSKRLPPEIHFNQRPRRILWTDHNVSVKRVHTNQEQRPHA